MQTPLEIAEMRAKEAERLYMESVQTVQAMQSQLQEIRTVLRLAWDAFSTIADALHGSAQWKELRDYVDEIGNDVWEWVYKN